MHNDSTETLALMAVCQVGGRLLSIFFLFLFGSWEKVKLVDMSSDALEEQAQFYHVYIVNLEISVP